MREAAAVSILKAASVVVSSLIGSGHENSVRIMRDNGFRLSTVVADEASQATEPSTLIALSQGCSRLVLVGDHCQLPPTVASPTGALNPKP
jgi:superfamily I DNA and/or RNA helicase